RNENIGCVLLLSILSLFWIRIANIEGRLQSMLAALAISILDFVWMFTYNQLHQLLIMCGTLTLAVLICFMIAMKTDCVRMVILALKEQASEMLAAEKEKKIAEKKAKDAAKKALANAPMKESRIVELIKTGRHVGVVLVKDKLVWISEIIPNGAAECQGGLKRGDEILAINGVCLNGATGEYVSKLIKNIRGSIKMEVRNNPKLLIHNSE
ncbi:hypothetical protein PENTCL1PPCAC_10232, partial [Pristionchus entomophagus]